MKCYLNDAALGFSIPSSEPVEMECAEVLDEWDNLSRARSSFLGLAPPGFPAIQFYWDDDSSVCVDIPFPEQAGSLTKQATFEECAAIIEAILRGEDPREVPGLQFAPW